MRAPIPSASETRRVLASDELVVEAPVVASALQVSLPALYAMVRESRCPVEPIHVGRAIRFRTSDVRALLGLTPAGA